MKNDRIILLGAAISILINLGIFFLNGFTKPIGNFHFRMCFSIPMSLAMTLALISLFIKLILHGDYSIKKWDCPQAREVILYESSIIRKILARLYLIIDLPLLVFTGWLFGFVGFMFVYAFP